MYPHLARIGPFSISTYGVAVALAFGLGVWLASRAVRDLASSHATLTPTQVMDLGCWIILGGLIGGRLLYVLLNWDVYRTQPQEILAIWHGGLIWYGAFIGGMGALWGFVKRRGLSFLQTADRIVPFVALGHAVGRIGCFANGCCLGTPTTRWFAVTFPAHSHPLVPIQLIESASLLGLFVILRGLQGPSVLQRPGILFGLYLVSYAMLRFVLEFWRANQPIVWAGLSLHQLLSLIVLVAGIGLLVKPRAILHAK